MERPGSLVLSYVQNWARSRSASACSDGELLERFIAARDETAFATLMDRYGPLILGVCRRVLRRPQDIEDAFQATFLVLLRNARSIVKKTSLSAWLYGVAYRTSLKARAKAERRHLREQAVDEANLPSRAWAAKDGPALASVVDQEISGLPEKYRAVILACCLQEKTNEEAAQELGWAVGTVWSRLSRGRELLRKRLARRGVEVAGAALGALLAKNGTAQASLVHSAFRAALLQANGAAVRENASLLAAEVSRSLLLDRLRAVIGVTLALSVLVGAVIATTFALTAPPQRDAVKLSGKPTVAGDPRPAPSPLPAPAAPRLESTLIRHGPIGPIHFAFAPDSNLLVSFARDLRDDKKVGSSVRLWELPGGRPRQSFRCDKATDVKSLSLSPDGKLLALGGLFGKVLVWDLADGTLVHELQAHATTTSWTEVAISPAGGLLVSAGNDGVVRSWELATGRPLRTLLDEQKRTLPRFCFLPKGDRLAAGDQHGVIHLLDMTTGKERQVFKAEECIDSLRSSPDGKLLAAAGHDRVRVWDTETGRRLHVLTAGEWPRTIVFSPDSKILATGCLDDTVRLWDMATGRLLHALPGHERIRQGPGIHVDEKQLASRLSVRMCFSPDSRLLATTAGYSRRALWDVRTGQLLHTLVHRGEIRDAALSLLFSPDGKWLASSTMNGTAVIWQMPATFSAKTSGNALD
jgi:RNA polymerase sigma factor (sigma-70 family)